ncbi:MAG TPA: hypothetical protein VF194_19635 [Ferrovibrio sp.]|uniref:hypothetical protein n=1 Tax=Ferrovibrio sp. TaxID=1917215 RepID=UPI002ED1BB55
MLISQQRPSVELYFGKSGEGKTFLALSHIGPQPAILYDINEQEVLTRNAVICSSPIDLVKALDRGERRICWRGFGVMGPVAAFEWANKCARVYGNRVLLWDDVDRMMPIYPVPVHADWIINAGRHRRLTIKASARRPANMPRNLTAAATKVYSYRIHGRRDLRYLADEWFDDLAARLPALRRGQALVWTERDGAFEKKIY